MKIINMDGISLHSWKVSFICLFVDIVIHNVRISTKDGRNILHSELN